MTVRRVGALDVASSARQVTRLLEDLGVPRGRGVAVLGANTPEFLAVFRGAVWSGRYFTAMSWRWTAEDVAYVAGNCEAGALFADARWPHLAAAAAPSFPEPRAGMCVRSASGRRLTFQPPSNRGGDNAGGSRL